MATKQDLHDSHHQQGTNRGPSTPMFYIDPATQKPINTGLREHALADWNARLIVGKETVDDNGSRLPIRPL